MSKTVLLLASMSVAVLVASGVAFAVTKDCEAGADFCVGTDGRDTLNGSELRDKMFGLAGYDLLRGNGGNDRLLGGEGADELRGGAGEDSVENQVQGNDQIYGESDDDDLVDDSDRCGPQDCFDDRNLLSGGSGRDYLYGHNRLFGGDGDDDLNGSYTFDNGPRTINGGPGEDRIGSRGRSPDTINAEDGERDVVNCGGGEDTVYFDEGIDSVNPVTCEILNPPR